MVSYATTDLPVNNIMQLGQPDPSAVAGPVSSVVYVLPAAHSPVLSVPLPNYGPIASASPPIYSPTNYTSTQLWHPTESHALPPFNGPVPSAPPPAYVTLDHKTSLKSLGYIFSNSQKYILWLKIIDLYFMPKIIRILSKDFLQDRYL